VTLIHGADARIVSVSSSANMMAPVFFDDPNFNFIPFNPWLAYGQSKTANVLMAVEATRRWANAGIFLERSESGCDSHESPKARRRQTRHAT
jgi:NAD(P)-dependent dehydrogenase (short-subunit alcohol dehydrogenase family)